MANPLHPLQIGATVISASNQEFIEGFEAGNRAYSTSQEPYTDEFIMDMVLEKMEDMDCSTAASIGFVVGWLAALAVVGGE
jgi:hypothetical protein